MNNKIVAIASWLITAWMCKVFLFSLPYKFTLHPDTQHIFGTIGNWMSGFLGEGLGGLFANYGSYAVGTFELITCLVLLSPLLFFVLGKGHLRATIHRIGGLMAAAVMAGAVFFHLATPLGVEVLHEGKSDGGSLFYAAVSILVLGLLMFIINKPAVNRY